MLINKGKDIEKIAEEYALTSKVLLKPEEPKDKKTKLDPIPLPNYYEQCADKTLKEEGIVNNNAKINCTHYTDSGCSGSGETSYDYKIIGKTREGKGFMYSSIGFTSVSKAKKDLDPKVKDLEKIVDNIDWVKKW